MAKYDVVDLVAASTVVHSVILDALIAQGVVDRAAIVGFLTANLENQHPEPLRPALQHLLEKLVTHLEKGEKVRNKTLQ